MKKTMLVWAMALAGCATSGGAETKGDAADGRAGAAEAQLRSTLEALPKCEAGVEAGKLVIEATTCTKMFCGKDCCNQCSWSATLETKTGNKMPLDAAKVRSALKVGDSALECEVAAWGKALSASTVAVDGNACVVR